MENLSKELERELIKRAQHGDRRAERRLLLQFDKLCHKLVGKYTYLASATRTVEDLYQEAQIGLLSAIRSFDLSKDVRLITWAYWRVRSAVTRVKRPTMWALSIEDDLLERAYNVPDLAQPWTPDDTQAMDALRDVCADQPTFELLVDRLGLDPDAVRPLSLTRCASKYGLKPAEIKQITADVLDAVRLRICEADV